MKLSMEYLTIDRHVHCHELPNNQAIYKMMELLFEELPGLDYIEIGNRELMGQTLVTRYRRPRSFKK